MCIQYTANSNFSKYLSHKRERKERQEVARKFRERQRREAGG